MKKTIIALAAALALSSVSRGRYTADISFGYRMGAGFPGDVNRTHPFSTLPGLINTSVQVPRLYGDPVVIDTATNSYRGLVAGDTAVTVIDGVAARPYPVQQTSGGMQSSLGTGAPPASGLIDIMTDGYVMVKVNNGGTPTKKGAVFVWIAASSGNHVQGGFESVATGGSTIQLANCFFNGPPDSSGVTEMHIFDNTL